MFHRSNVDSGRYSNSTKRELLAEVLRDTVSAVAFAMTCGLDPGEKAKSEINEQLLGLNTSKRP